MKVRDPHINHCGHRPCRLYRQSYGKTVGKRVTTWSCWTTCARGTDGPSGGCEARVVQFIFVQGDVAETALVVRLVHEYGVEAAVHFAALSLVGESMQHPERYFAENVAKGISFFNALVSAGVKNVVFSSTAACTEFRNAFRSPKTAPRIP